MVRIIMLTLLMLVSVSCTNERKDLKSPCVGAEGSPCGPHKPVNDWWMS